MSNVTLLGIDLAKDVFQLHGIDSAGKVVLKSRLSRKKLVEQICKLHPCTIAMEACSGSSYWARKFSTFGHIVKLISPQYVKPFVKTNKNDRNDAEAICEAASRPSMRFVTSKNIAQQDVQALHRMRSRCIDERTALVNQMRGLLREYGITIAQGIGNLRSRLPEILEDASNELSMIMRRNMSELLAELRLKDERVKKYEREIKSLMSNNKAFARIEKIPGIGLLTASAIIAYIGNEASGFDNGRHLSAYFGLVPRQKSSGNKERLLGISRRGDTYIRELLIHGARAVIKNCTNKEDKRSRWIKSLKARNGYNKTAVAVANKNTRIVWALLSKGIKYDVAA